MKSLVYLLAALVAFGLTGCSTFKKEWKEAVAKPTPAKSIEGAWAGEWLSDKNGHHGSLRCVVTKTSQTSYRAHFRAKYMKILRYTYAATLTGSETNGVVSLKGEAKLPWLAGGLYRYEGTVSATDFKSSYACKWDHGNYQMARASETAGK